LLAPGGLPGASVLFSLLPPETWRLPDANDCRDINDCNKSGCNLDLKRIFPGAREADEGDILGDWPALPAVHEHRSEFSVARERGEGGYSQLEYKERQDRV
jgi:hypothetical protein